LSSAGARRTTTSALALSGGHDFESVVLTGKRVTTNIGIIRDPGHTEPWINRPVGQAGISDHPGICRALGPGMGDHANNPISAEKKRPDRQPAKLARGKLSWFTRGIRRAIKLLLECLPLPKLRGCLLN
jgi:hypothetical protein